MKEEPETNKTANDHDLPLNGKPKPEPRELPLNLPHTGKHSSTDEGF